MKKIFTIILGWLGIIVLATPALAAITILLAPLSIDVTQGQSFDVVVIVNPQGVKNYTVKVELEYPVDLLEVNSFTFENGWMELSQPGYDLVDNTNGLLIKTAGYPGGVSELITFGTVLFSAKKTGEGIIKIGESSLVLDVENHNVLIGPLVQASVTIAAPPPPEEEIIPPEEEVIPPEEEVVPLEEVIPPEEEVVPPEEEVVPSPPRPLFDILIEPVVKQLRKRPSVTVLVVDGILLLIIVAYIIYRRRKKKVV